MRVLGAGCLGVGRRFAGGSSTAGNGGNCLGLGV